MGYPKWTKKDAEKRIEFLYGNNSIISMLTPDSEKKGWVTKDDFPKSYHVSIHSPLDAMLKEQGIELWHLGAGENTR